MDESTFRPPGLPSGEQIELIAGDQRAVVVEVGGGLRAYSIGAFDVLDGYDADAMARSGRGQVLMPWPNRLADGRYDFGGRTHQLPLNEPEKQVAIHGLVRWVPWRVAEREPGRVVLEHLLHPQPGYPFSLALRLEYVLSEDGLAVRATATNVGAEACPYGDGAHPYLTVGEQPLDSWELRLPAGTVLCPDERGLPVGSATVQDAGLDFRRLRPLGETRLDHAFADLERDGDGLARVELRDPSTGRELTLWVDAAYRYLMVFTGDSLPDVNRRSLAVEPMTCPPNAFRSGESLIVLQPGESSTASWGISPRL